MRKIKENKALQKSIEWLKNNKYCKVISVSEPILLGVTERIVVSEIQGDQYCTDVHFTAMQKVIVEYDNNGVIIKDEILAGFDAVRYTLCDTSSFTGDYLSDSIIKCEFIGEYSKIRQIKE